MAIAIPVQELKPVEALEALHRAVEVVRLAAPAAPVHVFYDPARPVAAPAGVAAHAAPGGAEPESPLPAGWLASARMMRSLEPGAGVLIVNPRNSRLTPERVAQALAAIRNEPAAPAVLSATSCRDHPCQWGEFFDVVASQMYVPVAQEGPQTALARTLLGAVLGPCGDLQISEPFAMPPGGPWPRGAGRSRVYEWLPVLGELRRLDVSGAEPERPMAGRVFLVHEQGAMVRQAVCCGEELAALALFRPVGDAPACFVRRNGKWVAGISKRLDAAAMVEVVLLPGATGEACRVAGLDMRTIVRRPGVLEVGGGSFVGLGNPFDPPAGGGFLFNALASAVLPEADIFLNYRNEGGGWDLDRITLAPVNAATGAPISGRQCFPEVVEFEGSLLGLPERLLGDPLAALLGGERLFPVVLGEGEIDELRDRPALPDPAIPRERAPREGAREAGEWARRAHDGLRDAEAFLGTAREALGAPGGEAQNAARALAELEAALEALANARHAAAALHLGHACVRNYIARLDAPCQDNLSLHINALHNASQRRRVPMPEEQVRMRGLMVDLVALWRRGCACTAEDAAQALRRNALERGLPSCWAEDLPYAVALGGGLDRARQLLQEQYADVPWIEDAHTMIAAACLRPEFRFDEYLDWIERDAKPGRLSLHWVSYYCEALAVCRMEKRAEQVAEDAYRKLQGLNNCLAMIAWWRFVMRDFNPARALPGFEKDAAAGRLSGVYVILHAASLAAAGEVDRACETVARAYRKDATAANGYAMVGWYAHLLRKRDVQAAIALFGRDAELGRLDPSWRGYLAAAHALNGDMEKAEQLVAGVYADSPLHSGCLAQVGLMHWLRHRDVDAVLGYFGRDRGQGRLASVDLRLIHAAFLLLAGRVRAEELGELLAGVAPTEMAWDLCLARLGLMGFRQEDCDAVMTPDLRKVFLALGRDGKEAA